MNNSLNAISVTFRYPWLLLLLIPAAALMLIPYLRIPKQRRRTRNRVISLVLHGLILVLCVLMVSGMNFRVTNVSKKSDVILLVDLSDSNRASEEEMNDFIRSMLDTKEDDYKVGIISFANGAVFSAEIRSNADSVFDEYLNGDLKPLGNATDIAAALEYARSSLANPKKGRVILLSDGLETDGNALASVKALADEGVRVDAVYFAPKGYEREVEILSVDVPDRASLGDDIRINVLLRSSAETEGRLKLFDNGEEVGGRDVTLSGGENAFAFDYRVASPGMHSFYVTLDAAGDSLSQNNEYYSYINIETSTKVLLVDGTGSESASLREILQDPYDVTVVTPDQLPTTLEALCAYDEVVLMNVANSMLPVGFDQILSAYVKEYGGGLYTVGGDQAYKKNDMSGTTFESLLPVETDSSAKSLGLLLIIDRSSSMDNNAVGTTLKRIDLALDAACRCVDILRPGDYVGVIAFDENKLEVTDGLLPVSTESDRVKALIRTITVGYGTKYSNATDVAMNRLMSFNKTDLRHIIFLTDGETMDSGTEYANCLLDIQAMARAGITLSTITLGPNVSTAKAQEMAETYGNGRFYNVAQETGLIEIMSEETVIATEEYSNQVVFTPQVGERTPSVAGIGDNTFPELRGFYGSKLKQGALSVLKYGNSTIYAEWTCEKGKVGSFMSDLSGRWSSDFLSSDVGKKFLLNSVGNLFPKDKSGDEFRPIQISFEKDNHTTQLRITLQNAEGNVYAELRSPDGTPDQLTLERASDHLYVAEFPTKQSGIYTVTVSQETPLGIETATAYTEFSYSAEYDVFHDDAECFSFMESLSSYGNGKVIFSADGVFGAQNEMTEENVDPRLVLLIVCAVLFLLDIVVRKFKIKTPHEIAEDRRRKKEERS